LPGKNAAVIVVFIFLFSPYRFSVGAATTPA